MSSITLRTVDLRLVVPAAAAWVAAWFATAGGALAMAVALGAAAVVTSGALLLRPPRLLPWLPLVAVALGAAALVSTVAAVGATQRNPQQLADAARAGRSITAIVVTGSSVTEGRVEGEITEVLIGGAGRAVRVPALVFADLDPRLAIGSVIRVSGVPEAAEPGDDRAFLVFVRGPVELVAAPAPLLRATEELRAGFRDAASSLPGAGGRLLPGLALGDTQSLDDDLVAAMQAASLTHLTAVSGANCAVVVALGFGIAALLGAGRIVRIAVAATLLVGFVVLVTPEPSVLRAATMAGAVLVALAVGRPVRGSPVLALAVLVLLVVDPWLARDYGFVLSVLATGGLLLGAGPLGRSLARVLPRRLAIVVAVPLAAQLACQPVILLLDPGIPLYAIPANLLAEPAAPVATVLGLVACLALPILPGPGQLITALAWLPAAWIAAVATAAAALPGARLPWPGGVPGMLLLAALSVVLVVGLITRSRRSRTVVAALLALALVSYGAALGGTRIAEQAGRPSDWELALCDVGQGDATLVRSEDVVALVDTGPEPQPLAACLDDLGIDRIDLLVLTHFDLDHVGGVDAVVGRVTRTMVGPSGGEDDDRIAAALRDGGALVTQVARGERGSLGGLDWRVLWPPRRGVEPGNDASVVLSVHPGAGCPSCLSAILLGDLGEEPQLRLLGAGPIGSHDVVKVAHHGSADQSPELYQRVHAAVGLIGVGADNDYGHPTARSLDALAAAGTAAYRSDLDGLVLVAPSGEEHSARVWTQRSRPDAAAGGPGTSVALARLDPRGREPDAGQASRPRRNANGREGRHPAAQLGSRPPRSRRARLRHRVAAGRPGDEAAPRHTACGGPESRGPRHRRRLLRPGRAPDPGQPLPLR